MKNRYGIIIQARNDSQRLPCKLFYKVGKYTLLEILLKRLSKLKVNHKIIIATTTKKSDDSLVKVAIKNKVSFFRGSVNDVLSRFQKISKKYNLSNVIRITSDCTLADVKIIEKLIKIYETHKYDLVTNTSPPTFPDGLDCTIINANVLNSVKSTNLSNKYKEHVTLYFKEKKIFKTYNLVSSNNNFHQFKLSVDSFEDYKVIKFVIEKLGIYCSYEKLKNLITKNKKIFLNNINQRNNGEWLNSGQKKWIYAKKIIPGGNNFLSKRPEQALPNLWPVYFKKAKKTYIWDLSNKKYLDFGLMGVGTNILGYSNPSVNKSVKNAVELGSMSTLNSYEEVRLSQKLLEINKWADMVRLARSGGEANAVSIRIARLSSKTHKIAICGYHGWHDWYLSANLSKKKNLDTHLLKGLPTKGVPSQLKNTVFPFKYNDLESLKKLIKSKKIGIIKMEVFRNIKPKKNFLKNVRKLCDANNIILIFDECTSGFRETFGGLHLKYKVYPDIAIYGKALGNGHPITAIVGKRKFMDKAKSSFISSTFWSDRVGPAAALKTLELMQKNKSWEKIKKTGINVKVKLKLLAKKHKIKIILTGLDSIININFGYKNNNIYKTFFTQEMLKNNILCSNKIFISTEHKNKEIKRFLKATNKIFSKISDIKKNKDEVEKYLKSDAISEPFQRLN